MLLERSYWRNRLQELDLSSPSVLLIPRPELSTAMVEVDEFRVRTHDGIRLFGLRAQSRIPATQSQVLVRLLGPCETPELDHEALEGSATEFLVQEPAGRRLEDRVMDVIRVCRLAAAQEGTPTREVRLVSHGAQPDEFLIATQLLAGEPDNSTGADDETAGLD